MANTRKMILTHTCSVRPRFLNYRTCTEASYGEHEEENDGNDEPAPVDDDEIFGLEDTVD